MAVYTLTVDAVSEARSLALVAAVQAAYDAAGYPPLVVTQAYVLQSAVRVGLHYWIPPAYALPAYPAGAPENLPTLAKLTPTVHGSASHAVDVPAADVTSASAILAEVGGGTLVNVLGCALCTGVEALFGSPARVGPWLP